VISAVGRALLVSLVLLAPLKRARAADYISLLDHVAAAPGFTHLPYADPDAPKGGSITQSVVGDFDNFNPFILRGTAPVSVFNLWQGLLKASASEAGTAYCDLAKSVDLSEDGLTLSFTLHKSARFSDGVPVTTADVAWTFHTLINQGAPFYRSYYAGIASIDVIDPTHIVFKLKPGSSRTLPLNIGEAYILPAHFWAGKDFTVPVTTPPPGSGPYQISAFALGRSITYTHVKHWWAADLPADRGLYNFTTEQFEYFRDANVAFQAFKAGQVDFRLENAAKSWASDYGFPAVQKGAVVRRLVPYSLPVGMYGLYFNVRRPVFANRDVRHALVLAFDCQWMNRVLFYHSYVRSESFFANSDMASTGLPSPGELALLAPFKSSLPASLFNEPFSLPVTDGSGYNLPALEQAMALLNKAGWHVRHFKLVNAAGQQMRFEILVDNPTFDRILIPYVADLKLLGIDASVRSTDEATYERRLNDFDFDMTQFDYPQSEFPGTEQAGYWGCKAAHMAGSSNLTGICTPAIDAMIAALIAAPTHHQAKTAVHALDRLLLHEWIVVPWWHSSTLRIAYWNRFGMPPLTDAPGSVPRVGFDLNNWWYDPARAAQSKALMGGR
jgi:microcin C transport system substrate-binding protein